MDPTWSAFYRDRDPEGFAEWFEGLADGPAREEIQRSLRGVSLAREPDPLAAAHRIFDQTPESSAAASDMVRQLANIDPRFADRWMRETLPTSGLDGRAIDGLKWQLAREVSRREPAVAFAWVSSIGGAGLRRDAGAGVFSDWSQFSPVTAEREFLAAGWDEGWIAERYGHCIYELR